jgi:hypothetical protein
MVDGIGFGPGGLPGRVFDAFDMHIPLIGHLSCHPGLYPVRILFVEIDHMYLCFIDESGTPPTPNQRNPAPYWVLAAVIIHEAQWRNVSSEFLALKRRFSISGEVKWRYFGSHNTSKENSVSHLSRSDRDKFRRDMYSIITRRNSIRIIYAVCSVAAAYEKPWIGSQDDLYFVTYKPISERFQYFLQDMSREVGDVQLGIVVADHQGRKQDDTLRNQHQRMVRENNQFTSNFGNYVETIFLTPSHHSVGIQFADMVAGGIGRKFISNDATFFDMFKGSFRRSSTGTLEGYGAVKVPKQGWR